MTRRLLIVAVVLACPDQIAFAQADRVLGLADEFRAAPLTISVR